MNKNELSKQELVKRLYLLPAWTDKDDFTSDEWAIYIDLAKIIQSTDAQIVEAALQEFVQRITIENKYEGYEEESKPFILMRVIFDLPESADVEKRFSYKGWINWPVPDEKNKVNLSWPVSWEKNAPKLLANYKGSMGLPYAAAEEYRFLLKNYPFRNLN